VICADSNERYASDLYKLAAAHPVYLRMLESRFTKLAGSKPVSLPPCDSMRHLLVLNYATLHWHLEARSQRDTIKGWWVVTLERSSGSVMRRPQPFLSDVSAGNGASPAHLLSLDAKPWLRFIGLLGPLEEVLDLVGSSVGIPGILGVRPGRAEGEVLVYMSRSAIALTAFRDLTGKSPGPEPALVLDRSSTHTKEGWNRNGVSSKPTAETLFVVLENMLTGTGARTQKVPRVQP